LSRVQVPFPAPEKGGIAKWLRQRSAKPLFIGSNPIAASIEISRVCKDYQQLASPFSFSHLGQDLPDSMAEQNRYVILFLPNTLPF
jgi:hypothetical protein